MNGVDMSIPLAKVLDALKSDLKKAQKNSDPKNPLIIEDIEVELQTVVTWGVDGKGEATGKVDLKVLDFLKLGEAEAKLNANGKWEKASTQKIKLKLSAASLNEETGKLEKTQVSDTTENEPEI
ncbi:trypco2 family protein [Leucothrix pacifica]|uniref:Trypsin-co-occurring domain-containing protein n=1 Tax=Leucothrix pacifica TaxID=1247513 RepID=A0A317CQF3_9GAMM|nr:trypco2 family protein [Leucothrix pacifica]PWQ98630.1 hypothetical protein DKW60_07800 [Leucothrix pacifica]